jgi:hypothetical protein
LQIIIILLLKDIVKLFIENSVSIEEQKEKRCEEELMKNV